MAITTPPIAAIDEELDVGSFSHPQRASPGWLVCSMNQQAVFIEDVLNQLPRKHRIVPRMSTPKLRPDYVFRADADLHLQRHVCHNRGVMTSEPQIDYDGG
jgi:hypothetical protein